MASVQKMQMRRECIEKVSLSLGRQVTPSEASDLLKNIRYYMRVARDQAESVEQWDAMPRQARVDAAVKLYQQSLLEEAAKIRQRARQDVLAQASVERSWALQHERGYHGYSAASRVLDEADRRAAAAGAEIQSDFLDALDGIQKGILNFMEDRGLSHAVVREIFGENTGSALAKKIAGVYARLSNAGVDRYNRAGGNMGKLDHYIPQTHDSNRLGHAVEVLAGQNALRRFSNDVQRLITGSGDSYENNKRAWVAFTQNLLDKRKYTDLNGDQMNDADIEKMLRDVYDTIMENGADNFDVSTVAGSGARNGSRSRVNRGELHRALHFKDATSQILYHETFGAGSFFGNMNSSLARIAKDASLLESFGTNPNNTVSGLKRMAAVEVDKMNSRSQGIPGTFRALRLGISEHYFDAQWNTLNGAAGVPQVGRETIAAISTGARNLEVVGKLQSTLLSSISDLPSYFLSARIHKIPMLTATRNLLRAWGKDSRDLAIRGGLMADALASNIQRFGQNNVGQGWTGFLANATMKLSLLDAWTNGVRQASMINMMGAMARIVAHPWKSLEGYQKRALDRIGVTERDWFIWSQAKAFEQDGVRYLTRQDIREIDLDRLNRNDDFLKTQNPITQQDIDHAVTSYMAFLRDESGMASLAPDLGTRAVTNLMGPRGTVGGEAWRCIMLFKSFPIGFMRRHLERMSDLAQTGEMSRAKYAAMIIGSTTLAGAISVQLKALAAGRDLQDADPANSEFWWQAFATGGGAGFLSDIIVSAVDEKNAYGSPNFLRAFGPVIQTGLDTWDVLKGFSGEALYDKETQSGAKALRLLRGHMPFVNLWYTKGIFDRAIYNDLMEWASPGYTARVENWALKNTGQQYWWNPTEVIPRRAPRMAEAPQK